MQNSAKDKKYSLVEVSLNDIKELIGNGLDFVQMKLELASLLAESAKEIKLNDIESKYYNHRDVIDHLELSELTPYLIKDKVGRFLGIVEMKEARAFDGIYRGNKGLIYFINAIYVKEEFRNKGIASYIFEDLRKYGHAIVLESWYGMSSKYYQQRGFKSLRTTFILE